MVNPGEIHDGGPIGPDAREWRMLYFDPRVIAEIGNSEGAAFSEVVRPVADDKPAAARFHRLFAVATDRFGASSLSLEEGLVDLVMYVARRHGLTPPPRSDRTPWVARARERLDDDPATPVSLTELADFAGVSRFQLVRAFRRQVGITPHAYLVQRRVSLARQLLVAGQPLVHAAINAGFADQSHMTRAFVRQFGVTPGRYVTSLS
jgi:AraC-like DNA-binding protein